MADTQWLTQAQYDLLASELKERIEVKRVEIARLIDAARQEGDLRENGGYHAARNEQSMNEHRRARHGRHRPGGRPRAEVPARFA